MSLREFCPACGGGGGVSFTVNGYDILRCADCGTLFVGNVPRVEELAAIYAAEGYYGLPPDAMRRIADENRRRLKIIRRLKPGGNFLDIGCAQGLLLDEAAQNGYVTSGIEPSVRNAKEASRKGHDIFNGELAEFAAANPGKRFDIVACLDVIEHINEPGAFLSLAASLLSQGGIMVVSTPNYSGLVARLLRERDPYMTPPEHLTFLTSNGLRQLAASAGLCIRANYTFGRLIPAEMDRSVRRFLPKPFHFFGFVLRPLIRIAFWLLNLFSQGLEQEVYLVRMNEAPTPVAQSA